MIQSLVQKKYQVKKRNSVVEVLSIICHHYSLKGLGMVQDLVGAHQLDQMWIQVPLKSVDPFNFSVQGLELEINDELGSRSWQESDGPKDEIAKLNTRLNC